jgi:3-carboxy-cis,cis-muconate cycloisomerase
MTTETGGLFSGLFARGPAAAATADRAVLQALLDVELALMRALVICRLAPAEAAEELGAIADASAFDLVELGCETGTQGTPVPGLLAALRARLPETARAHLHMGATSQDVLDSALMLVSYRALEPLVADLDRAAAAAAALAERHRDTLMPGRTLLQQALPVTFGLKAAGWLAILEDAGHELAQVREQTLALQFGGAVGTLAALGDHGAEVGQALAIELGLPLPPLPWHTNRLRPARLAGTLGAVLGAAAKVARDIVLLAQTEVAEVAEGGSAGRGGSSAMPHKRNPVGAIAVLACAGQAPGLVATVLGAMAQEHERGAGSWQSEWEPLLALLRLAGSAAAALAETLTGLRVDAVKMRADLELAGAAIMSESLVTALTPALGRSAAQELVRGAAAEAERSGCGLDAVLFDSEPALAALGADGVRRALEPERYLGMAQTLIDRALTRRGAP